MGEDAPRAVPLTVRELRETLNQLDGGWNECSVYYRNDNEQTVPIGGVETQAAGLMLVAFK